MALHVNSTRLDMSIPTMHYPASCRDAYHINILYVIYETPVRCKGM